MSYEKTKGCIRRTGRVISLPFVLAGGLAASPFYLSVAIMEGAEAKVYQANNDTQVLSEYDFEARYVELAQKCQNMPGHSEKLQQMKSVGTLPKNTFMLNPFYSAYSDLHAIQQQMDKYNNTAQQYSPESIPTSSKPCQQQKGFLQLLLAWPGSLFLPTLRSRP